MITVASAAGLPHAPPDGTLALVRIGAGQDTSGLRLVYNAGRDTWIGRRVWEVVRDNDQQAHALSGTIGLTVKQYVPQQNAPPLLYDSDSPHNAGLIFAAGLGFEYQQAGLLKGAGAAINLGTYFYGFNTGDSTGTGAAQSFTNPPPTTEGVQIGGYETFAETDYLNGGRVASADHFQWIETGWKTLQGPIGGDGKTGAHAAINPLHTFVGLYAAVYGWMDAGATAGGTFIDYICRLRAIAPGT